MRDSAPRSRSAGGEARSRCRGDRPKCRLGASRVPRCPSAIRLRRESGVHPRGEALEDGRGDLVLAAEGEEVDFEAGGDEEVAEVFGDREREEWVVGAVALEDAEA